MDRYEAFQGVVELVRGGSDTSESIDLCRSVSSGDVWDRILLIDWEADREHCRRWLLNLLQAEPPAPTTTGFWFGIFNPVRDGEAASDFYLAGSSRYPSSDWTFDSAWEPNGRYAKSPAQSAIYRLATDGAGQAISVADYVLTFAHAAGTVNDLIKHLDRAVILGRTAAKGIAVGHDSGDSLFLGELTAEGMDRSKADWV